MSQGRRRSPLPPNWNTHHRPLVFTRDPHCTLGIVCDNAPSSEVHHLGAHDDHRLHMLTGVCHDCHKIETARTAAQERAKKFTRKRPETPHPGLATD